MKYIENFTKEVFQNIINWLINLRINKLKILMQFDIPSTATTPPAEAVPLSKENAIEIRSFEDLDPTIEILKGYQAKGESVYIVFGSHRLYSADITEDGAYQTVTGMTKAEAEEKIKKSEAAHLLAKEASVARKNEDLARVPEWIELGKSLVDSSKLGKWEEMVKYVIEEGIFGKTVQNVIELMEQLESGASIEEVQKTFDKQGHSGGSYATVRSIVGQFSKRGEEFDQLIKL